ncbi:MAG: glycerol-3-phosphate dehydrogenase/oxidase [Proteobacteria bacterium]|nr:glycerol-3-phosphate dehydrogenase/oxidase [Pseudomonadota bacterium]
MKRLETEEFDFLVVGGGITGAGVAWDASSRGYTVALIEKFDFAHGTSSRSSKLVHGGLRYLENYEFPLVFEALSERSYLLQSAPHLVRPLPFYMPVYEDSPHSAYLLSAGMWFYDFLALGRAPSLHQRISGGMSARMIPGIKRDGLTCTFKYYDASMWDDALVLDVLAQAHQNGAAIASRAKAVRAHRDEKGVITAMTVRDELAGGEGKEIKVRFKKLIVCAGVWTDEVGQVLEGDKWHKWIAPSRGLHLVFDWKKFPVPGAVTMQINDGRIAFVIPRHDFGPGITIVGTTDGPCSLPPDQIEDEVEAIRADRAYLLELLSQYFPNLHLTDDDVVNHYIGIRPLVDPNRNASGGAKNLQKVSREHTIDHGPGGSVIVAGGKYTTFRKMAEQIVDFAIQGQEYREPETDVSLFEPAIPAEIQRARETARARGWTIPEKLFERYGADALEIHKIHESRCDRTTVDPEGFPLLEAQFRYAVRHQMVISVEDFVRRRQPLHLCRKDHGAPWYPLLEKALRDELSMG